MGGWGGGWLGTGVMRIYTLTNQLRRRLMLSLFREASKVAVGFYRRIFAWTNKHPTRTPPATPATPPKLPLTLTLPLYSHFFPAKRVAPLNRKRFSPKCSLSIAETARHYYQKKKEKKSQLLTIDSDERVPKLMTFYLRMALFTTSSLSARISLSLFLIISLI